jgi:hypothetical protein
MPHTDYVAVYDADGCTDDAALIGRYYGYKRPPPLIESTSIYLCVWFHTDHKVAERGFNATFQEKGEVFVLLGVGWGGGAFYQTF